MKKVILVLLLLTFKLGIAQTGWFWQNPKPCSNTLSDAVLVNGSTIYAISEVGGAFVKSTNNGVNWSVSNILPVKDSVYYSALSMYSTNVNNIYILYSTGKIFAYTNRFFIMKSTNAGNTWDSIFIADRFRNDINKIVFINNSTGYCYTSKDNGYGIYKTTNSGINWEVYRINSTNDSLQSLFFLNENTGWIGGYENNYYYKTTDAGSTWLQLTVSVFDIFYKPYFINENTGWYVSGSKIRKTTNGGINFLTIGNPLFTIDDYAFTDENTGWCLSSGEIYTTSNSGADWIKTYNYNSTGVLVNSVKFLNDSTGISAGKYGGILKTTDKGNNWSELSKAYNKHSFVTDICFVNSLTGWSLMHAQLMKSTDGGNSWQKIDSINTYRSVKFKDENTGAIMSDNFFSTTTNGGATWIKNTYNAYSFISAFFVSANTWYVFGGAIFKTTNSGLNWNMINPPSSLLNSAYFTDINTGYLAGTSLYKTTNGGVNWFTSSTSLPAGKIYFINSTTGWAYNDYNIFKTTNSGANWETQFSQEFYQMNSINFVNSLTGFCAANAYGIGRILKTTNGGSNWFHDFPYYSHYLNALSFINPNTGWAAGEGETILKTTTGGSVFVAQISSKLPDKFYLSQNYPNPFNPNTNIEFSLPQKSFVKLKVFDLLGRDIANLVNENLSAGSYKYDFNASALTSGIYFYKLETDNFSETRKMVLVK